MEWGIFHQLRSKLIRNIPNEPAMAETEKPAPIFPKQEGQTVEPIKTPRIRGGY